jgi:hypothetical protein
LKLLKENIGQTLQDAGIGNHVLYSTLITQEIIMNFDNWDCSILKAFCTANGPIQRIEKWPTKQEKKSICQLFM